MEITTRGLWTLVHGMGFGALFLLACSGAFIELYRWTAPHTLQTADARWVKWYLVAMVAIAWLAVLSGAYIVYPWYRAVPPPGTTALMQYPQKLLLANANTSGWHSLGMEWKEHIAWFAPIAITMVAYVFLRYGSKLRQHRQLRAIVLLFALASFASAGIAGFFGAMIDKVAPVEGGGTITLSKGGK